MPLFHFEIINPNKYEWRKNKLKQKKHVYMKQHKSPLCSHILTPFFFVKKIHGFELKTSQNSPAAPLKLRTSPGTVKLEIASSNLWYPG